MRDALCYALEYILLWLVFHHFKFSLVHFFLKARESKYIVYRIRTKKEYPEKTFFVSSLGILMPHSLKIGYHLLVHLPLLQFLQPAGPLLYRDDWVDSYL